MKINDVILNGYDNSQLTHYSDLKFSAVNLHKYAEIGKKTINGVLKASFHRDGELVQLYSENENHVGVIAATRLGKTTSYVIPTILSFSKQKIKRSMIISDPKGELYKYTAQTLKDNGYEVKLLNFRDYRRSECWNILTPIYRKYLKVISIPDEVQLVTDAKQNKTYYSFRDKTYQSQEDLDAVVEKYINFGLDDVGNDVDTIANLIAPTLSQKDPYWEDSARELMKAFMWAMLEDVTNKTNPITEDTFSFSTILTIMGRFKDEGSSGHYDDGGYFTKRPDSSRAKALAKYSLLENANVTRRCVISSFNAKIAIFRESAIRLITSCNSFDMSELVGDKPIAIFINYRDELKVHYTIISMFVQDAYRYLIERATQSADGKLASPFYFILDEFGNFPKIKDFENTISACAGRNIWFILIIQSYAQLDSVYGENAKIVRDNLNMHVFFGSNNPSTLDEFSKECGNMTRISPLSALNGKDGVITHYEKETIPLVPKSRLSHFDPGECIITEANCGYVLYSKLERYFTCEEFKSLPQCSISDYQVKVDPSDRKYTYDVILVHKRDFSFDF